MKLIAYTIDGIFTGEMVIIVSWRNGSNWCIVEFYNGYRIAKRKEYLYIIGEL